jgi:hypothetical protein
MSICQVENFFDDEIKKFYEINLEKATSWLICGVNRNTPWPENDKLVKYDNIEFILRGIYQKNRTYQASIILPLTNKEDRYKALDKLYEFCSLLTWSYDDYVNIIRCVEATTLSCWVEGDCGMIVGDIDCELLPKDLNKNQLIALAFYKEGLNPYNDVYYSFLNFYKIIELGQKGEQKRIWINKSILELKNPAKTRIDEILKSNIKKSEDYLGEYIWQSCRCAIVHTGDSSKKIINPDSSKDKERMREDIVVIKSLAQKFIIDELKVPC